MAGKLVLFWLGCALLWTAVLWLGHRRARPRPMLTQFPRSPNGASAAIPRSEAGEAGTPGRHAPGAPTCSYTCICQAPHDCIFRGA